MRVAAAIILDQGQRGRLQSWARGRRNPQRLVERSQIILLAAEGKQNLEIAEHLNISRHQVARWRERFLRWGVSGLEKDAPRPGRTPTIDVQGIVQKTAEERPANATHWSTRSMARAAGVSEASVRRVWRAHGLKPHTPGNVQGQPGSPFRGKAGRGHRLVSSSSPACPGVFGG